MRQAHVPGWGAAIPRGFTVPVPLTMGAAGGEARRVVPGTASSLQVPGLRLGQRYTFTIRPLLGSTPGAESSISERPGMQVGMGVGGYGVLMSLLHLAPSLPVCRDARGDIVFLVHGTRDSSSDADTVRTLLSNTVTAMGRLGPDGTQV